MKLAFPAGNVPINITYAHLNLRYKKSCYALREEDLVH